MKYKALIMVIIVLLFINSGLSSAAAPVIRSDQQYYDINTGLYILKGNVYIEVKNRIIKANLARVSMSSLEVWGSGGISVTQDDISFSGENVYVYGLKDSASIDGGVRFLRTGLTITASRVDFNWKTKIATFSGDVQVTQNGNMWGTSSLSYNVDSNTIL